jgi:hypothetical protein
VKRTYFALAALAAAIVYFANARITAFLGESSATGAIALFVVLPLAAILTRPVIVAEKRGRKQRAIGLLYALRSFRLSFFVKSIGWWILFTVGVVLAVALLYREAALQGAEAVSNWWYVTNLLVLVVHLIPGQFRLPARRPVTIIVLGAKDAGKSTFIGLQALEKLPQEWSRQPSDTARNLVLNLLARAKGSIATLPDSGTARFVFTRPGAWSMYTGVRPTPVDFVEVDHLDWRAIPEGAPRGVGVALLIPANGGDEPITAEVQRLLHAIRTTDKMTHKGRIVPPVAVVLTKSDLAPSAVLPKDAVAALDQDCRGKWAAFQTSDRDGEPADVEGFSPKGNMTVTLWLLRSMK